MADNEGENTREIPYLFYKFGTRKPAKYVIGGTPYTAKSALAKFPRLIGILQPGNRRNPIKRKSVEDKFRRYFRKGKFKNEDFRVDAPEFLESARALDGTFKEFTCDDPIIGGYDLPSLFDLMRQNIKEMMRENSGTKVYLNLVAMMKKLNDETEASHTFYSGEFEIFPGTDFDDVIEKMKKNIFENFEKMETAVGSGWGLVKIQNLKLHFAEFKTLKGSSYLPYWIKNKKAVINILNKNDNECFKWCITRAMNPIGKHQNDSHVSNLRSVGEDKFKITQAHFPWSVKFKKVIRKGVFPYEWLTDVACFAQPCLPQKDQFYSRLNSNGITDADYNHAKDVWKTFEMKSMREYHSLYLKTDVLLLADVFENFRDMALEHFKVDPCHYVTAPAMFFDALLKMS